MRFHVILRVANRFQPFLNPWTRSEPHFAHFREFPHIFHPFTFIFDYFHHFQHPERIFERTYTFLGSVERHLLPLHIHKHFKTLLALFRARLPICHPFFDHFDYFQHSGRVSKHNYTFYSSIERPLASLHVHKRFRKPTTHFCILSPIFTSFSTIFDCFSSILDRLGSIFYHF